MGWTDSHLHQFNKDGKSWGVPEWDEFEEFELIDESKTHLAEVLKSEGDSVTYLDDFGDGWQHEVVLGRFSASRPPSRIRSVLVATAAVNRKMSAGFTVTRGFWK